MKIPFVTRKNYEILKGNYKLSVEHRQKLQKENIELQKKIKALEEELKQAKIKAENEYLRRCPKCNKYFTVSKHSKRVYCMDCKNKKKGDK